MQRLVVAYVVTGMIFLTLDGGWLTLVGPTLYKPEIGPLLAGRVRAAPAVLFYLLYVVGLIYFCVAPNFEKGWMKAAVAGAMLGLVAYGAYDLTCQAVMATWSTRVSVADMIWGAFASAAASAIGVAVTRTASRNRG
ncbi:DUF2177 family protein [Caulobacter sp. S45]|uniref:DUF2177 family protein n=1 Tax=Caulobacter sp. S45 TaxID=1641861 RepID=UPI0015775A91|nr:DUF2177 family protein [Caulobacter sp. S45]